MKTKIKPGWYVSPDGLHIMELELPFLKMSFYVRASAIGFSYIKREHAEILFSAWERLK